MINGSLLNICKIKMEDITVIFGDGSVATIPSKNVYFLSIEKDFFDNFLPILNVKCMVNRQLYTRINKEVPKFKIDIKKFYIPNNGQPFDKERTNVIYKQFVKNVFINVNDNDSSPDLNESLSDRSGFPVAKDRTEYEKDNIELDLYLFTESSLNYRTLNNKIFRNCNLMEVILALTQLMEQNKVLMTIPDNRTYYDSNILIPQNLTFLGCIKYLQGVYGLYNKGYILFNDFDTLYLIDKGVNCNAYRKGEFRRVYMEYNDILNSKGNNYGQFDDNVNKRYMINCITNPQINTNSTSTNELLFDTLHATNTYNGKSKAVDLNTTKQDTSNKVKVVDNRYNNSYIINSSTYEIALNNCTLTTTFNEVDLDIFTPNREYYLNINIAKSDYRNMNGLIKLSKLKAVYQKQDDEMFNGVINAEFKRA